MNQKVGSEVRWTSQAAGTVREKRGTVLARLPAGESFYATMKKLGLAGCAGSAWKVDADDSTADRYIVSVPRVGTSGKPTGRDDIYAPRASVVDKHMTACGSEVRAEKPATSEPAPLKKPGDRLEWASGANWKPKRGRVLGVVPGGASLRDFIVGDTGKPATCVQAQDTAQNARYVVAVERKRGVDYYAPVVRVIDNGLRREAKAQEAARRARA